jgi:hypothetical protein
VNAKNLLISARLAAGSGKVFAMPQTGLVLFAAAAFFAEGIEVGAARIG